MRTFLAGALLLAGLSALSGTAAAQTSPVANIPTLPTIATASAYGLPTSPDTLVGLAATQTLSNKTFVAPALGAATGASLALGGALAPVGYSNPLLINVPNITGVCSGASCSALHPSMIGETFGSSGTPDNMSNVASTLFYHELDFFVGGSAQTGARGGFRIAGTLQAANPLASDAILGFGIEMAGAVNVGGTAPTLVASRGRIYGENPIIILKTGATDYYAMSGHECDMSAETGSSVAIKTCYSAVSFNNDAVQGSVIDTAYLVSAIPGAVNFKNGLLFTDVSGQQGISSGGCLICTQNAGTVATGFDASSLTITGNFLNSQGFSVSGTGAVTSKSLSVFSSGTNDPIAQFGDNSASDGQSTWIHNGSVTLKNFVAGGAAQFLTDAAQGDSGITYSTGTFRVGKAGGASQLSINSSTGAVNAGSYVAPAVFTVATLPASPPKGARAAVSDATACTFGGTLTGSSTVYCPVTYNGAAWVGG